MPVTEVKESILEAVVISKGNAVSVVLILFSFMSFQGVLIGLQITAAVSVIVLNAYRFYRLYKNKKDTHGS